MRDVSTTIDLLFEMWNEPEATKRTSLAKEVFTDDGRLVDPPVEGTGHDGISEMMGAVRTQFADHSFRRVSAIDAHHDTLRYGWELVGPDGAVVIAGLDVGHLADDGRLRRITGFLGPLPEEQSA
jgi:hypothetical protein